MVFHGHAFTAASDEHALKRKMKKKTLNCMVNNALIVQIKHGILLLKNNDIIQGCTNGPEGFLEKKRLYNAANTHYLISTHGKKQSNQVPCQFNHI